jgi:hypothetical protein
MPQVADVFFSGLEDGLQSIRSRGNVKAPAMTVREIQRGHGTTYVANGPREHCLMASWNGEHDLADVKTANAANQNLGRDAVRTAWRLAGISRWGLNPHSLVWIAVAVRFQRSLRHDSR